MKGDWAPGTTLRFEHPAMGNLLFDENGKVVHLGLGAHFIAPSGDVVRSHGHTAELSKEDATVLQEIIDRVMQQAADLEGVELDHRAEHREEHRRQVALRREPMSEALSESATVEPPPSPKKPNGDSA